MSGARAGRCARCATRTARSGGTRRRRSSRFVFPLIFLVDLQPRLRQRRARRAGRHDARRRRSTCRDRCAVGRERVLHGARDRRGRSRDAGHAQARARDAAAGVGVPGGADRVTHAGGGAAGGDRRARRARSSTAWTSPTRDVARVRRCARAGGGGVRGAGARRHRAHPERGRGARGGQRDVLPLLFISDVFIPHGRCAGVADDCGERLPDPPPLGGAADAFNPFERGSGSSLVDLAVLALWTVVGGAARAGGSSRGSRSARPSVRSASGREPLCVADTSVSTSTATNSPAR